jgi:DNA-binding MarR family transcriptional regulator
MKVLALHGAVEFRELKAALDLTDGNLASHLRALEGEGLIVAEKGIVGKRMRTTYVMTESGRAKFRELTSILEGLVK